MNNKSFLQGLLFGLAFGESVLKGTAKYMFYDTTHVIIWFNDGSRLIFAINRGISHRYGNKVAMLTQENNYNLFDIAPNWISEEQITKIEELGFDFSNGEIRITLEQLFQIVDVLGTIDYEVTQQEWLKIYLERYHEE